MFNMFGWDVTIVILSIPGVCTFGQALHRHDDVSSEFNDLHNFAYQLQTPALTNIDHSEKILVPFVANCLQVTPPMRPQDPYGPIWTREVPKLPKLPKL